MSDMSEALIIHKVAKGLRRRFLDLSSFLAEQIDSLIHRKLQEPTKCGVNLNLKKWTNFKGRKNPETLSRIFFNIDLISVSL